MKPLAQLIVTVLLAAPLAACGGADDAAGAAPEANVQTTSAPQPRAPAPEDERYRLVMLGDSLFAGYQLDNPDLLAERLTDALGEVDGRAVAVINAGVSGETAADGLRRFDWSVGPAANGVLIEFGANDVFAGRPPSEISADLAAMIDRARERGVWVGLVGMLAPLNADEDYRAAFDRLYFDLAHERCVPLYPFYFDGLIDMETVSARSELFLEDGLHPNAAGVGVVAEHMGPWLDRALAGGEDTC